MLTRSWIASGACATGNLLCRMCCSLFAAGLSAGPVEGACGITDKPVENTFAPYSALARVIQPYASWPGQNCSALTTELLKLCAFIQIYAQHALKGPLQQ